MPSADSTSVSRQIMPAAIASWSQGTHTTDVFSSGVRIIPPVDQSATKNPPSTARISTSVFSRRNQVARSIERNMARPSGVRLSSPATSRTAMVRKVS